MIRIKKIQQKLLLKNFYKQLKEIFYLKVVLSFFSRYKQYIHLTMVIVFFAILYALFFPIEKSKLYEKENKVIFSQEGYALRNVQATDTSARSTFVVLENISPKLIESIIYAEDKNFYLHSGLDVLAVVRALKQNLISGKIVSGASTLSMQLAKIIYADSLPKNKWLKKIITIYLALRLENNFSKKEILASYVNRVPMPANCAGMACFCSTVLQKDIRFLSTMEISTAVALIKNHHPSFQLLQKRSKKIWENIFTVKEKKLVQVFEKSELPNNEFWNEQEFKQIFTKLKNVQKGIHKKELSSAWRTPHFVAWSSSQPWSSSRKEDFFQNFSLRSSKNFSTDKNLHSTISSELSKEVEKIIQNELRFVEKYEAHNAAVLVLEKGEIKQKPVWVLRVMLGSQNFSDDQGENNGVVTVRQAGSTLKPFVYALAFDNLHLRPWHRVNDSPTSFYNPDFHSAIYKPKNYDLNFWGNISISEALSTSRNIPAVEILSRLGVDRFYKFLQKTQITNLRYKAEHYGPGMALGNSGAHLLGLTRAYGIMAAGGKLLPVFYAYEKKINPQDNKTKSVFHFWGSSAKEENKTIFTKETALLINEMLSDKRFRKKSFGSRSFLDFPYKVAVKTGTSKDYTDSWTVGYNDRYVVGVWLGNFSGEKMNRISGAFGAGRIFHQTFRLLQKQNFAKLTLPSDLHWRKITVCQKDEGDYLQEGIQKVQKETTKKCLQYSLPPKDKIDADLKKQMLQLPKTNNFEKPKTKTFALANNSLRELSSSAQTIYNEKENTKTVVQFISPLQGEQFLLDPHMPLSVQRIPVQIKLTPKKECVYRVGVGDHSFPLSVSQGKGKISIVPQYGYHRLILFCNDKQIASVSYEVLNGF